MRKVILFTLSTVVLRALGNALWELIKSGVPFLGSAVLAMITLGIDSIRDDIYVRAGRADLASTWIKASFLLIFSFLAYLYTFTRLFTGPREQRRQTIVGFILLQLVASFNLFTAVKLTYVASARSYFNYLDRASAPYLTSDQRLSIDSRLALVHNKAAFDKLVAELKQTLRSHNIEPAAE